MKTNTKFFSKIWLIGFAVLGLILLPLASRAGFGISPPYVQNEYLARGSTFDQKIILVRGDPVEDLKINLTVNVPGAAGWFSIDKGLEFIMPKGATNMPIIITVKVPADAQYADYKGTIGVSTSSPQELQGGSVGIALGGQIDVNLKVSKDQLFNFNVRGVKVSDLEEGHPWLWWQVPGVIKFEIQLENLGNVKAAPTKVAFDIYDSKSEQLLEKIEAASVEKADPFTTKWIPATLNTSLKAGSYWARYRIYRNEDVLSESKIHLSILPYGSIAGASRGWLADFSNLQSKDKKQAIGLLVAAVVVLLALAGGVYFLARYIIRRRKAKKSWLGRLFKRS